MTLSATFALVWRERRTSSVRSLVVPGFIFRLIFILPAFAPLLPEPWRVPWIVIMATLPGLGQGIAAVMFVVLIQESVPKERMTALFSRRSLIFNIGLAVSAVTYGLWLEAVPFPYNYQLMYALAFVLGMLSLWHCSRVTPLYVEQHAIVHRKPAVSPWRSRDFRAVLLIVVVTHISFVAVNALIPARLVEEMGANEGYMAVYGLVELFAGALVSYLAPRLIARFGIYRLMMVAMAATACGIAMLGISNSLAVGLVAAAVSGGGWMLVAMIGIISLYTETVPVEDAPHYSIAFHQVVGVVTFTAPFIGTTLIGARMELDVIMLVGAALRLLAALALVGIWYSRAYPARAAALRIQAMTPLRWLMYRPHHSPLPSPSGQAGGSAAPTPRSPKE
jgi:MFS family permease